MPLVVLAAILEPDAVGVVIVPCKPIYTYVLGSIPSIEPRSMVASMRISSWIRRGLESLKYPIGTVVMFCVLNRAMLLSGMITFLLAFRLNSPLAMDGKSSSLSYFVPMILSVFVG